MRRAATRVAQAAQVARPHQIIGEASTSTAPYRLYSSRPQASRDGSSPVTDKLSDLIETLTTLKEQSRRPAETAYLDLLGLASKLEGFRSISPYQGDEPSGTIPHESLAWDMTVAALADAEAGNIELSHEAYDAVASFAEIYPALLPIILRHLPKWYRDSTTFLSRLCQIAIHSNNVEQLLMVLYEMWHRGDQPSIAIITHAVRLCCDAGLPRLGKDVAEQFERQSHVEARLADSVWVRILIASADQGFLEGVESSWTRAVTSGHYTPDEGLLVKIMHVAARTGKPELVTRALDVLPVLSVQPQEYHLIALMEAYVNAGQVPQALQVLSTFRTVGLVPTSATAAPILAVLTTAELVDQAFFALEDLSSQGQPVDITAFNAVLEAASRLNDLQRVRATQLAANDLGVVPDIDTYNSALAVCASSGHRELGDTVLKELQDGGIKPNGTTYHHLICVCLTQSTYDDAFYYLEKSKAEGFKPDEEVYRRLALKCESARDPRYKLVVDELQSLGYKLERPREQRDRKGGDRRYGDKRSSDRQPGVRFSGERRPYKVLDVAE